MLITYDAVLTAAQDAGTTDRRAVVTWAEFEVPDAPRRAVVTWAELEVPSEARRAIVTWAELETPDAPRRAIITWAEFEVLDDRRAIITWAEIEIPDPPTTDRRAILTWAELETPDAPRRAIVTWAELETPDAPRRAVLTWAELETPDAPRRAVVTWAEFEAPDVPSLDRRAIITWAEFEVPGGAQDSGAGSRLRRRRVFRVAIEITQAHPVVQIRGYTVAPAHATLLVRWPAPNVEVLGGSVPAYHVTINAALVVHLGLQIDARTEPPTFDMTDEELLFLAARWLDG